jgi:uncharacterized protein (DUF58 family)
MGLGLTAVLLFAVGRLLGLLEFYFLGAMVALALALTALYVLFSRLRLDARRLAAPARPRVGSSARVDLALTNRARRRTPVLSAHDPIQGRRGANVLIKPIRRSETTKLAYRLPTARRGPVSIGPLELTVGDPLGLFQATSRAAEQLEVVILPELLPLTPLRATAGRDPDPEATAQRKLNISGEEFFALRPYVVGDELKRVDWRASARVDDLVVRQEEQPRSGRLTLLLDHHVAAYRSSRPGIAEEEGPTDSAFERAITVSASFLHAGHRIGESTRFLAADAPAATVRTGNELDLVEDRLARQTPSTGSPLSVLLEQACRSDVGGTLVVVTGKLDTDAAAALSRAQQTHDQVIVVSCIDTPAEARGDRYPVPTVLYARNSDFEPLWRAALAKTSVRVRAT